MSVEKIQRAGGGVWRVRWRDEQGRARSRVVGRKADATALDADLKRAKRLGGAAVVANHRETLAEFSKLWWARHAAPNLARHTQENYASALDVHIIPRLGDVRLQALTTELISDMRAEMAAAGVGEPAIRKVLTVLQSILERAVEWRHLDANPVRAVRKPGQHRTRVVRPLPPRAIEAMRTYLLTTDRQSDATLVAILAYAGLRPGEAIGLRWHDVGERTLLVERSVAFGQLKSTKTSSTRSVRLLATTRRRSQRLAPRRPAETPRPIYCFPPPTAHRGTLTAPETGASARSPRRPPKQGSRPRGRMTSGTASSASSSPRARPSSRSHGRPGTRPR